MGDAFVQVTTILGFLSSCYDVVKLVRITAVGAVMIGCVVPAMRVAVVLISVRLGSSAVVIMSEAFVVLRACSKDSCWSSSTSTTAPATAPGSTSSFTASTTTSSGRVGKVPGLAGSKGSADGG